MWPHCRSSAAGRTASRSAPGLGEAVLPRRPPPRTGLPPPPTLTERISPTIQPRHSHSFAHPTLRHPARVGAPASRHASDIPHPQLFARMPRQYVRRGMDDVDEGGGRRARTTAGGAGRRMAYGRSGRVRTRQSPSKRGGMGVGEYQRSSSDTRTPAAQPRSGAGASSAIVCGVAAQRPAPDVRRHDDDGRRTDIFAEAPAIEPATDRHRSATEPASTRHRACADPP